MSPAGTALNVNLIYLFLPNGLENVVKNMMTFHLI